MVRCPRLKIDLKLFQVAAVGSGCLGLTFTNMTIQEKYCERSQIPFGNTHENAHKYLPHYEKKLSPLLYWSELVPHYSNSATQIQYHNMTLRICVILTKLTDMWGKRHSATKEEFLGNNWITDYGSKHGFSGPIVEVSYGASTSTHLGSEYTCLKYARKLC